MASELACVYAALILQDDEVAITGDKIATLLKAASVEVEPFWPGLFAKALEGTDVRSLITNISSGVGSGGPAVGGGGAPAAAGGGGGAAPAAAEAPKKEEKKEEEEEEDEDMGFGLFD